MVNDNRKHLILGFRWLKRGNTLNRITDQGKTCIWGAMVFSLKTFFLLRKMFSLFGCSIIKVSS